MLAKGLVFVGITKLPKLVRCCKEQCGAAPADDEHEEAKYPKWNVQVATALYVLGFLGYYCDPWVGKPGSTGCDVLDDMRYMAVVAVAFAMPPPFVVASLSRIRQPLIVASAPSR